MPKPVRIVTDPTIIALANMMHLLQHGTRDMKQLAEETGLNIHTVERWCAALHRAKAIHIATWQKDARGSQTIRIYEMGEGVDAVPKIVTRAEKARRLRAARRRLREEFEATGRFNEGLASQIAQSHV